MGTDFLKRVNHVSRSWIVVATIVVAAATESKL